MARTVAGLALRAADIAVGTAPLAATVAFTRDEVTWATA